MYVVNVRWIDGLLEDFEASRVGFSGGLLFLRLMNSNRYIPLCNVRWWSQTPESKEDRPMNFDFSDRPGESEDYEDSDRISGER